MSDACGRCRGHGRLPKTPGDYREWITCSKCGGTGRRGGAQ